MRWDRLSIEEEATRQLPGYREPATVRTFDAPEAMDIRFYEVRAKSALNKVPKASRMPFRWTVNPYQWVEGRYPADARNLGGAARQRHSLLGADQVTAAAA